MKRASGGRAKNVQRASRARRPTSLPPLHATIGAQAAASWLRERRLGARQQPWYVEVAIDVTDRPVSITFSHDTDTRFHLNVYPEEWGVFFCHGSRASWIRVTDQPFVHGRDDHSLLAQRPELHKIGYLVHALEARYGVEFRREHALVRTNLVSGQRAIRAWLATL